MKNYYDALIKLLCVFIVAFDNAAVLCQSWGYNGHKRKYRFYSQMFSMVRARLKSELFDDHGLTASLDHNAFKPYEAMNMADHTAKWAQFVAEMLTPVKQAVLAIYTETGKQSNWLKLIVHVLYYEQEKARRWFRRWEAVKSEHDAHVQDDRMHEKFKEYEEHLEEILKWK